MPIPTFLFSALLAAAPTTAPATAPAGDDPEPLLGPATRLTSPEAFAKAGEAYFSPGMKHVIFQAVPADGSGGGEEHYQMYVAELTLGDAPTLGEPTRLSLPGSNNTCGYFLPRALQNPSGGGVIYATTGAAKDDTAPGGYQRESSDYEWTFPPTMEIVRDEAWPQIWSEIELDVHQTHSDLTTALGPVKLTDNDAYDAEGAYTPDGSRIVFTSTRDGDPDLYAMDPDGTDVAQLTDLPGYDGGAFVSPDGKRIAWRADRNEDDLLQLHVADFHGDRIDNLRQLTHGRNVNWAPYWHPDGQHLFYTTSQHGHRNYEVHRIAADGTGDARVTHAAGFDGLPVVSPDGRWLLWTSQRIDGSSQLYLAPLLPPQQAGG